MLNNIKSFIEESTAELESRQEYLKTVQQNINLLLKEFANNLPYKGIIIQSRVKDAISLNEKIIRKNYHIKFMNSGENRALKFIDHLPDLIGVRLVCLLNSEEENLYNSLRSIYKYCDNSINCGSYTTNIENDHDSKSHFSLCLRNQPEEQKNGMDIYRISCKWVDVEKHTHFNIELQIKSLTHLFWGEMEHMLFYKNYSYLIAGDFYHEMMMHLESELNNIDKHIYMLTKQVNKDEYRQTNEVKQIAGMFVFTNYNTQISNSFGFGIDLRDIYNLIVDIYFEHPVDGKTLMNRLDSFINKISNIEKNNLELKILSNTFDERDISTNGKYFAPIINNLVNSGDMFWAYFYVIFASIAKCNNHTNILKEISESFSRMIKPYESNLPIFENDDVDELIKNSIYSALSNAFWEYKKLDFFIYKSNLLDILEKIKDFIDINQDVFAELTIDEYENIKDLIEIYIKYCTLASCKVKIHSTNLRKIKELIDNTDIINIPFNHDKYEKCLSVLTKDEYLQSNIFLEILNKQ